LLAGGAGQGPWSLPVAGVVVVDELTVYSHALGAARRTGDRTAEATTLIQIGAVDEQAACHLQEAATTFRGIGDRFCATRALGGLGMTRQRQGRYQEAVGFQRQALYLSREIVDREGEARALARLGREDLRLGSYQHAAGYLQQALDLFQEIGSAVGESQMLARLGEVHLGFGRYEQAAGNFEQALAMFREIGNPELEANALNGLGEFLLRKGNAGQARAPRRRAPARIRGRLASRAGPRPQWPRPRLPRAHHWQEALTRYDAIGAPEATEIRAHLATAGDNGDDAHKPAEKDDGMAMGEDAAVQAAVRQGGLHP
jgi:tetratricopeptide (TPR) repeat protein